MVAKKEVEFEFATEDGYVYMSTQPIPNPLILMAITEYEVKHNWTVVTSVFAGMAQMGKMIVDVKSKNPPVVPVSVLVIKKFFKEGEVIDSPEIKLEGKIKI